MRKYTLIALFLLLSVTAFAQKADPDDPANVEKGKKLLQQAIEARGGAAFLYLYDVREFVNDCFCPQNLSLSAPAPLASLRACNFRIASLPPS